MSEINFTKMHGCGNDFILVDGLTYNLDHLDSGKLAVHMCQNHFGIGADGLIIVYPSTTADIRMRIFNPDGSEPEMCGNGIRCFARFVHEKKIIMKTVFSVETLAGIMIPALIFANNELVAVEVDMGSPKLKRSEIPMIGTASPLVCDEPFRIANKTYKITTVNMGNPHVVVFVKDVTAIDLFKIGPLFENHVVFPERINTEFVEVLNATEIRMRVWERGAGETMACGTGACAAVVAGHLAKKTERKVLVHLLGGDLSIDWQAPENRVMMTGPAVTVYEGCTHVRLS